MCRIHSPRLLHVIGWHFNLWKGLKMRGDDVAISLFSSP